MNFYIKTLGCKVNQAESDDIAKLLTEYGHTHSTLSEEANLIIINTCTVTHVADRKSRQMIRKLHEANPKAEIIITGCVVENPKGILPEIGRIVKKQNVLAEVSKFERIQYLDIATSENVKTRKHLLVQNGCNYFCSYCIIPTARNSLISKPIETAITEASALIAESTKEIVLTGINLGLYNNNNHGLSDLVERITQLPGDFRIRLGSIEPNLIDDKLLRLIETSNKVCPHLHIPLQGASDNLLKIMGRRYNKASYLGLIERIHSLNKLVTITTDIIVGHPGETEEDFKELINLLSQNLFLNIHLFMYSKRAGTVAYERKDHLDEQIKKERMSLAIKALEQSNKSYLATLKNKDCILLVEETENGTGFGYSEHYVYCETPTATPVNSFISIKYSV